MTVHKYGSVNLKYKIMNENKAIVSLSEYQKLKEFKENVSKASIARLRKKGVDEEMVYMGKDDAIKELWTIINENENEIKESEIDFDKIEHENYMLRQLIKSVIALTPKQFKKCKNHGFEDRDFEKMISGESLCYFEQNIKPFL